MKLLTCKALAMCLCLLAAGNVLAQSRPKRVKQPREVVEAYRVCGEFRRLLAEDLDFDRAFEATFTRDLARRREIAIAEAEHGTGDLSRVDTDTIVAIYKRRAQLLVLMIPLLFAGGEEAEVEFAPPAIQAIFERKPPNDPQQLQTYAAELDRDVATFRAHVNKLAATKPAVAKRLQDYKDSLLSPIGMPNEVVKPLTSYSRSSVLPPEAEYYQVDNCAVIREGGQMRLIGYILFAMRW